MLLTETPRRGNSPFPLHVNLPPRTGIKIAPSQERYRQIENKSIYRARYDKLG